jgi:hypothetical protein
MMIQLGKIYLCDRNTEHDTEKQAKLDPFKGQT